MKLVFAALCASAIALLPTTVSAAATSAKPTGDSGFKSLCLLNPGDGKALLPGYTVGDFIRKGKATGRLRTVITSRSGSSHILRFLFVDQLSLRITPVSLQFSEVESGPQCGGKRAAQLDGAAINFQRVNPGNAMVGAVSVMYTVIQEELEKMHASPDAESLRKSSIEDDRARHERIVDEAFTAANKQAEKERDACIQALVRKNIIPSPDKVRQFCK